MAPQGQPHPHGVTGLLHSAGVAEVETAVRRRAEYESDASLYRTPPLAAVFPRGAAQIVATLVCSSLGVPLKARWSGGHKGCINDPITADTWMAHQ